MLIQIFHILRRNLRKNLLLVLQFTLAIIALIMFMIEAVKITKALTLNIGYEVKGLIVGNISDLWGVESQEKFKENYAALRQAMTELQKQDFVEAAGYMRYYPYGGSSSSNNEFNLNDASYDAILALGLKFVYGRNFNSQDEFDPQDYCLINEKAYNDFKKVDDEPLGKNYYDLQQLYDDQFNPREEAEEDGEKREPPPPLYIRGVFDEFRMVGRFNTYNEKQRISQSIYDNDQKYNDKWNKISNLNSFVVRIKLDQISELDAKYKIYDILSSNLVGKNLRIERCELLEEIQSREPMARFYILLFVSLMLILIITVGIYGISKENVTKRIREIGIRIAFGGTEKQVFKQLVSEYGVLSIISVLLSLSLMFVMSWSDIYSYKFGVYEVIAAILIQWLVIYLSIAGTISKATVMRPNVALHYE
ncbi:MAG: FtsX-like permease family protein [Calditrichaeota bacterium]|nr:FtsX-like permease family protein [Calditrichota bacterium]